MAAHAASPQRTNPLAIASIVCIVLAVALNALLAVASNALGLVLLYPVGILFAVLSLALALVFGHVARSQIRNSAGTQRGGRLALAGIIIGWIGVGFQLLGVLLLHSLLSSPK